MNIIGKCPFCGSPVRIESVTEEVVYEYFISCAKLSCTECHAEFRVGDRRSSIEQNMTKYLIEKFNTRKPIEDMAEQIHNAGSCDGNTDYDKGWDAAMAEAERIVRGGT